MRISNKLSAPENPLTDIAQNLNIGNNYLDNVQSSIENYRKILEELMKMKIEQPQIFTLFEILRDIIKFQFKEMKDVGSVEQLEITRKLLKDL